jgi:hypothetical protein
VNELGAVAAYRRVNDIMHQLRLTSVDSSDVKLLARDNPIAQQIVLIQQHYQTSSVSLPSRHFGLQAQDLHFYELGKTQVTIYGRSKDRKTLYLSFDKQGETELDWDIAAPAGAKLDQDDRGNKVLTWQRNGGQVESTASEVWHLASLGLDGFRVLQTRGEQKAIAGERT